MLTTVLLVAITFLLTMSTMTVSHHEVAISGAHRDGTTALDLAESGVNEATRRMNAGVRYTPEFEGSLAVDGARLTVKVSRRFVGVNAAYQEIHADASVGRAVRRLGAVILHRSVTFPPNVISAESLIVEHDADLLCGDVYVRTFVRYARYPSNACPQPPTLTYAGWWISNDGPDPVRPCFSHAACVAATSESGEGSRWYPAQRQTEIARAGEEITAQSMRCPAGDGGALPLDTITGVLANDPCDPSCTTVTIAVHGFDTDDPDGDGGEPPQAIVPGVLPCGLPHRWKEAVFIDDEGRTVRRLVKSVAFHQWFAVYWRFDEGALTYVKRSGSTCTDAMCLSAGIEPDLERHPEFGAVIPFPEVERVMENFDCRVTGGGTVDLQAVCESSPERPVLIVLDEGDYRLDGESMGHGTLVVNGGLGAGGDFVYSGTLVVNGTLIFDSGRAVIRGGVVVNRMLRVGGHTKVESGGLTRSIPIGPSVTSIRAWWER